MLIIVFFLLVGIVSAYTLYQGWNLRASPYDSEVSVEQGLSSIDGCYEYLFSFEEDGIWRSYSPLSFFNNLNNLSRMYGYWIKVNCTEVDWDVVSFPENCTNGFDDDLDDNIDCDDSDCVGDPGCPLPDGYACIHDIECASNHCENGFCCASGDCCSIASDCPGGYSQNPVCDNSVTCQGHRMDASCVSNICGSQSVDDDSDCDASTLSKDCSYYLPVYCGGSSDQSEPTCPTSCVSDSDCDPASHCDGTCQADLADGQSCDENSDCISSICTDGVCCATSCGGTCQSCNIAGFEGTCTNIPSGQDPDSECGGLSCNGYYWGWSADDCYDRADLSSGEVGCNGVGSCQTASGLCPSQGQGDIIETCHATCQDPTGGTCTGMTAGTCTNVNPGNISCGVGECYVEVPECVGGVPNECTPGVPSAEVCDGLDNDCDGSEDNGNPASMCPPPNHVSTTACSSGNCIISSCSYRYYDVNSNYADGCECYDTEVYGSSSAYYLGSMDDCDTQVDFSRYGKVPTTGAPDDWYRFYYDNTGGCNDEFYLLFRSPSGMSMRVYLYASDQSTLLRSGTSSGGAVKLSHGNLGSGYYFVRVQRQSGSSCSQYHFITGDGCCSAECNTGLFACSSCNSGCPSV